MNDNKFIFLKRDGFEIGSYSKIVEKRITIADKNVLKYWLSALNLQLGLYIYTKKSFLVVMAFYQRV